MKVRWFLLGAVCALISPRSAFAYDEDKLIALARSSVMAGVRKAGPPRFLSTERARPVFVTIERGGQVIGCRGGLMPRSQSLEAEVAATARSAATTDPRYRPLSEADLKKFRVTVTVVQSQRPLEASAIHSLQRDEGLVLKAGNKTGIVLPWEGSEPRIRWQWAYKKAGVTPGVRCQLFRLKAERFAG